MADNFLERHMQDYEARKQAYMRKKRHVPPQPQRNVERPDDEAL